MEGNPFAGTGLWDTGARFVESLLGWLPVVGLVLIVGALLFFGFVYVAKGGGQYGIIEGYVGTIGAGKTTLAVQHAMMLARARGAVLLSNIPVVCGPRCSRGREGPGCLFDHALLPVNDEGVDLGELTRRAFVLRDQERGLVLLLDEVGVIMPARLWKEFSVALMWVLQQSRKLSCEWIWTAQDPSFVDHQLRSLTSVVHYVRSYPPPSVWRRVKGKRPWLLVASAFSPSQAPRANGEGMKAEKRMGRRLVRYRRKWEAAFDTDGVVLPSAHLKGAGVIVQAVGSSGDVHVIGARTSSWGPSSGGSAEPDQAESFGPVADESEGVAEAV